MSCRIYNIFSNCITIYKQLTVSHEKQAFMMTESNQTVITVEATVAAYRNWIQ